MVRCALIVLSCVVLGAAEETAPVVLTVFDDDFVSGWETHQADLAVTDEVAFAGRRAIRLRVGGGGDGWNGSYQLIYGWTGQFTAAPFDRLEFMLHGGESGGQRFQLQGLAANPDRRPDRGGHFKCAEVTIPDTEGRYLEGGLTAIPAGRWVKVTIPLADFGVERSEWFRGWRVHRDDGQRQAELYLDELRLVGAVPTTVRVSVDADERGRRVQDRIFGICTYSTPGADSPGEVRAAIEADYELQRVFYPTFNARGWRVNLQKGMLFAEATDAAMMGVVNWSDQPPKEQRQGERAGEYGTPEEAAAYVAYCNVAVDAPRELLDLPLGVDANGTDWKTVGYWVSLRAEQAPLEPDDGYNEMRIRRREPWGVTYWELDNEPWMHAERKDWLAYATFCKQADALMKRIDPTILTGPTIQYNVGSAGRTPYEITTPGTDDRHRGFNHVVPYLLAGHDQERSPGRYVPDFVVVHNYAGGSSGDADLVSLMVHQQAGNGSVRNQYVRTRELLETYYGGEDGRRPFVAITEWNMRPTFPLNRQYSSIVGALYVADTLGAALRLPENSIEIMTLHDWADGPMDKGGFYENPRIAGWRHETGYGVYRDGGETRYPIHYAFRLLSRFFAATGDTVVAADTAHPMLQPYALHRSDGSLALLLINKHPEATLSAELAIAGFEPGDEAAIYRYGRVQDRAEDDIALELRAWSGAPLALPPYSMAVVVLPSATAATDALAVPRGVHAIDGDASVRLRWPPVAGAEGYRIERGSEAGDFEPVVARVTTNDHVDSGLVNGRHYRYRVRALFADGRVGEPSQAVLASPAARPTVAPQGLEAIAADGEVVLRWDPVPGATGYTVRRATAPEGPFEVITTNPYARDLRQRRIRTEHHDRTVENGTTYHYQVAATTAGGKGPVASASAGARALGDGWRSVDTTGRTDTGTTIHDPATGRWILHGEGAGEYDGGDGRFVYRRLRGDFSISARVLSADHGQYGKNNVGVHLRRDLEKGTPFWATMGATPGDAGSFTQGPQFALWSPSTKRFIHRDSDDRSGRSGEPHIPYWVRLERRGETVTGSISTDGDTWREWKQVTVAGLPAELHVGLFAQSNYPYATAEGVLDQVRLEGETVD